jgi:ATP-dependent RNA helicase RhlE
MPFASLGLMPELTRALADRNYLEPTPVQARVIPEILAGRDILAGAQTGTGKTAGFTLPLLQRLNAAEQPSRFPRALILVPTRELASQVSESIKSYGKYLRLRTLVIFGGVSIRPQVEALRRGADIIVATPGRLLDHAQMRNIDLGHVEMLVLDEADRMLDMGFINDIRRVIRLLPPRRQNMLFSATYSDDMRRLAQGLLQNPVEVEVARRNAAIESVEQQIYKVTKDEKRALLSHLIKDGDWSQVLIFTRTKHGANRLAKQLEQDGIESDAIHGNKSQAARTRALADFKTSRVRALVATEVASRGLDIKELPHVVNYELPNVPEDYVHRIGRTGRAGATGIAVSLVSRDEASLLRDIERVLGKRIPEMPVPEFAAAPPEARGEYREQRAGQSQRGNQDRSQQPAASFQQGVSQDRGQPSSGHRRGPGGQDRRPQSGAPRGRGGPGPRGNTQSSGGPAGGNSQGRRQHSAGGRPGQPSRGGNSGGGRRGSGSQAQRSGT